MIQSAVYGHMEVGKCIKADIGFLGCSANVIDLLDERCSGKQSCEIPIYHERFREFQPCTAGIDVYLDATYACVKAIPTDTLCNMLTANSRLSYISSLQIYNKQCLSQRGIEIHAATGQNIELSIINVAPNPDGVPHPREIGHVSDGEGQGVLTVNLPAANEADIGTSQTSTVSVVLDEAYAHSKFLMAYRGEYSAQ